MKRILIVDDDSDIQALLKNRLTANGYTVFLAQNGLEALSQIKSRKPDLIIMDVYMPHMDGLSLFQELQTSDEFKDIPILVMTGVESTQDVFVSTRITKFVTKPFDAKELMSSIEECVSAKK